VWVLWGAVIGDGVFGWLGLGWGREVIRCRRRWMWSGLGCGVSVGGCGLFGLGLGEWVGGGLGVCGLGVCGDRVGRGVVKGDGIGGLFAWWAVLSGSCGAGWGEIVARGCSGG